MAYSHSLPHSLEQLFRPIPSPSFHFSPLLCPSSPPATSYFLLHMCHMRCTLCNDHDQTTHSSAYDAAQGRSTAAAAAAAVATAGAQSPAIGVARHAIERIPTSLQRSGTRSGPSSRSHGVSPISHFSSHWPLRPNPLSAFVTTSYNTLETDSAVPKATPLKSRVGLPKPVSGDTFFAPGRHSEPPATTGARRPCNPRPSPGSRRPAAHVPLRLACRCDRHHLRDPRNSDDAQCR